MRVNRKIQMNYVIYNQDSLQSVLSSLANFTVKEKMELIVRPFKSTRSQAQNRLYWKWMKFLADETGHDKDEMHEFFKHKFLGAEYKTIFGHETIVANSSAKLKVAEFADYLTRIEVFAAQKGHMLPHTVDYEAIFGATKGETVEKH